MDAATSQTIITGLSQSGIAIPNISATAPVTIPVTITSTASGVSVQSTANSPLFASFTGDKAL